MCIIVYVCIYIICLYLYIYSVLEKSVMCKCNIANAIQFFNFSIAIFTI